MTDSAQVVGSHQNLWPLGLSIIFVGSLAGAAGDTMVRMSYSAAGPDPSTREMLRKPSFVVGMLLTTVVDAGCTLAALTFAPSSMVTPFAGVHIFWSVLLAHFWLREKVGRWEVLGSSFVISGVLLLVLFSGRAAEIHSISQFRPAATTPLALVYITSAAGMTFALVLLSQKLYPCSLGTWEMPAQRLSLALASGVFGGNTNVSSKFLTTAATQLFKGDTSVLWNWEAYAVLFATIILALLQLLFLNTALRKFEAIYVIPTTNSCLVAEGIVGAIMVLGEHPSKWVCFLLGLFLCVSGILVLTLKHKVLTHAPKTSTELGLPPAEEFIESHKSWAPSDAHLAPPRLGGGEFVPSPTAINTAHTMQQIFPPLSSRTPSLADGSPPEVVCCGVSGKAAAAGDKEASDSNAAVAVSFYGSRRSSCMQQEQQQQQQAAGDSSESTSDRSPRRNSSSSLSIQQQQQEQKQQPQQQQQQAQQQQAQQQQAQQQRPQQQQQKQSCVRENALSASLRVPLRGQKPKPYTSAAAAAAAAAGEAARTAAAKTPGAATATSTTLPAELLSPAAYAPEYSPRSQGSNNRS